jgi:CRISPR/Cas system CSM-associated protein Csm3 (group 7 of RAMP superfamily)
MSADRLAYAVSLVVRSPFLFRGLDGQLTGVDSAQLRDEMGHPIIPSDQIRGVMRDALEDIATASTLPSGITIAGLFGAKSDRNDEASSSNAPLRGSILFSDLTATSMVKDIASAGNTPGPLPDHSVETTRIEIDDTTGAVADGMVQIVELVAPFGASVIFTGEIVVFRPKAEAANIASLLSKALACITSMGAFKTSGFGEIVGSHSTVTFLHDKPLTLPTASALSLQPLRYRVTFDRPVLVDGNHLAENAFKGARIIPGGVFKGALARRLELSGLQPETGALGNALARLRFSHAFPEATRKGEITGLALPLSMVAACKQGEEPVFNDMFARASRTGDLLNDETPYFPGDWKYPWFPDAETLLGRFGGPDEEYQARTHTKIDREKGVAEDEKLFTTIAHCARRRDGSGLFSWIMEVDPNGSTTQETSSLIAALADGLDNIGKTGASATFEVLSSRSHHPKRVAGTANTYAVMLATPALMFDPQIMSANPNPFTVYEAYWKAILPNAKLSDCRAEQGFAGGYQSRRHRMYGANTYFPFILTLPGSIFLIETENFTALHELCRTGLPLPTINGKPLDWKNCPYVPENGYGQILADHLSVMPAFTEFNP